MTELRTFNYNENQVRTVEIDGAMWFVGKDVAETLGYTNPRKALADHVDTEDKGVTKCDTLEGAQEMTIINESGLYSLILSSKIPTAKDFKRWVTSEVLPTIRKHGAWTCPVVSQGHLSSFPHAKAPQGYAADYEALPCAGKTIFFRVCLNAQPNSPVRCPNGLLWR